MNPAFDSTQPPPKPFPVGHVVIAVVAATVLFFAAMIAIENWPEHFDYEFKVTDAMMETCFGGDERFDELNQIGEITLSNGPDIYESSTSIATYSCSWRWMFDEVIVAGQSLTIDVSVRSDRKMGGYASIIEQHRGDSNRPVVTDEIEGFDEGYCLLNKTGDQFEVLECKGAVDNLEVSVTNDSPYRSASTFGPGGIDIEELTVEIGAYAKEQFRVE